MAEAPSGGGGDQGGVNVGGISYEIDVSLQQATAALQQFRQEAAQTTQQLSQEAERSAQAIQSQAQRVSQAIGGPGGQPKLGPDLLQQMVQQAVGGGLAPDAAQQAIASALGLPGGAGGGGGRRRPPTRAAGAAGGGAEDEETEAERLVRRELERIQRPGKLRSAFEEVFDRSFQSAVPQTEAQAARVTGRFQELLARTTTGVEATDPLSDPRRQAQLYQLRNQQAEQRRRLERDIAREAAPPAGAEGGRGGGLLQNLGLTGEGPLRAIAALTGIGLGLNVAATFAHRLHQEIVDSIEAEVGLERATRATVATFGGQADTAQRAASAFTADPRTRGTPAQFLQEVNAHRDLTVQFGLEQQQVLELTNASGILARVHGVELPVAAEAVRRAITGDTQSLQQFGIVLTDSQGRLRDAGLSYAELEQTSGRARASQVLLQEVVRAITEQQERASGQADSFTGALDRLTKASDNARRALGAQIAGPAEAGANILTAILDPGRFVEQANKRNEQLAQRQLAAEQAAGIERRAGRLPGSTEYVNTTSGQVVSSQEAEAAAVAHVTEELQRQRQAAEDARSSNVQAVGHIATQYELLSGRIEQSIASLQRFAQQQGQLGQLGAAARGPDFPFIGGVAPGLAQLQASQDIVAGRAQRRAIQEASVFRAQLVASIEEARQTASTSFAGPTAAAAGATLPAELQALDRRTAARNALLQSQEQQARAQENVAALNLEQQTRELAASERTRDTRREQLDIEQSLSGVMLQQANLQDQMRLAQRDSLDLRERDLRAQRDALIPQQQLADLTFEQQDAQARIEAHFANQARGVSDRVDVGAEIQRTITAALSEPEARRVALEAGRPAQITGQARAREAVGIALAQAGVERGQRALEDGPNGSIALERRRRESQAALDEIQRQITRASIEDEPRRAALQKELIDAQAAVIDADRAIRTAGTGTAIAGAGATIGQIVVNVDGSANMDSTEFEGAVQRGVQRAWASILAGAANAPERATPGVSGAAR